MLYRLFLDIPSNYGGRHVYPRVKPKKVIEDTVDTLKDSIPDSVSVDTVNAASSVQGNIGAGGDDASMLIWGVIVVLAVLAMCLYFAYSYRKSHVLGKMNVR